MRTLLVLLLLVASCNAFAQIDTTSYPNERRQIKKLVHHQKSDSPVDCNDFIAVGPKGDISFSHHHWQKVQNKMKVIFKSVQIVPGQEFIRIYEGRTAVVNFLAAVHLTVEGHDVHLKVRRLEVYQKTSSGWCRVAGQGTEVDEKLFPVLQH